MINYLTSVKQLCEKVSKNYLKIRTVRGIGKIKINPLAQTDLH